MLDRDQVRAGRNVAQHPNPNPQQMLAKPIIELDPAEHDRQRRPVSKCAGGQAGQDPQQSRRIEDRRPQDGAEKRHQMSAHTATRRNRSLLYSPKRVRKLGSVGTPSITSGYLRPKTLSNS